MCYTHKYSYVIISDSFQLCLDVTPVVSEMAEDSGEVGNTLLSSLGRNAFQPALGVLQRRL